MTAAAASTPLATALAPELTARYEFYCPITRQLIEDPVIAADGFSYEVCGLMR